MKKGICLIASIVMLALTINAEARMYDPAVGKWMSRDPIGETGNNATVPDPYIVQPSVSQANLYQFVGNNPINYVDSLGLFTEVLTFSPVGHGASSFGHTAININGNVYSWGPNGMWTGPFQYYMQKNSFRDATGSQINLTPDEEKEMEEYLKNYEKDHKYRYITLPWENCSTPVADGLHKLNHVFGGYLTPDDFKNDLLDSGMTTNIYMYPKGKYAP